MVGIGEAMGGGVSVGLATPTRVGVLVEVDGKTGVDTAVTVPAAVGGLVGGLGVRLAKSTGPQFVAKDASAADMMINGVRQFLTGRFIHITKRPNHKVR